MNDLERWTLTDRKTGRERLLLNTSNPPPFCAFDYEMAPDATVNGTVIEIGADPDADTVQWFPDVRRGMEDGLQNVESRLGRRLVQIRVTLVKIYAHLPSTTARGCQMLGRSFTWDLGKHYSHSSPDDTDEPIVVGQ